MLRRQVVKAKGKLFLQTVSIKPDRQTKIREQTDRIQKKIPNSASKVHVGRHKGGEK